MNQRFDLNIEPDKLKELIELAEEREVGKLVDQAMALYYTALKMQTKAFRLGLIPVTPTGGIDHQKAPIFIDVTST